VTMVSDGSGGFYDNEIYPPDWPMRRQQIDLINDIRRTVTSLNTMVGGRPGVVYTRGIGGYRPMPTATGPSLAARQHKAIERRAALDEQIKTEKRRERARGLGGQFKTLGEMARAVMRATREHVTDSRLVPVPPMLTRGSIGAYSLVNGSQVTRAPTGAFEASPDAGGFLIPPAFADQLLGTLYDETSQLGGLCRRLPTTNLADFSIPGIDENSRKDGSRLGGVLAAPLAEGVTITGSLPRFHMLKFAAKKYAVIVYGVNELVQDVAALSDHLLRAATEELGFWLDKDIIAGPGAGRLLGITDAPGTVTITKDGSQPGATVTLGNVQNMTARLPPPSRRRSSTVWLAHADCKPQFGQLNYTSATTVLAAPNIYLPRGTNGTPYDLLDGFPILYCEQSAQLGTKGDLLLCDLSHYLLLDGGIKPALSMHYDFLHDQSIFRFVMRVDGQPEFATAVTPYSGSNQQSAFVAVETRA
jgi:HK97 family phage major capsid protein